MAPVTFVTHKLIPQPPGSDQLTLSDINWALCLLGQLPKRMFCLVGPDSFYQLASFRLNAEFEEIGLPYSIFKADQSFDAVDSRSDFGGAYFAADQLQDRRKCQTLSLAATEIGIVDALSVTNNSGEEISHGNNTVWTAIKACTEKGGIKSSEKTTILIIGVDYNARAASHAVQSLGALVVPHRQGEMQELVR